ncbi:MAG: MotA/TolQ/ExbB proton channel family protein [Hyphomicrobiaceae bacterium]|nr:MotA/TolQ/ExbB proton channel family protein [Hyphomicrobiaceae bacterium]
MVMPDTKSENADAKTGSSPISRLMGLFGDDAYDAVLRWLIVIGLICLGSVILWDYGFLGYMFDVDSSRISILIIIVFAGFSGYCLLVLLTFAREYRFVAKLSRTLHHDWHSVQVSENDISFPHGTGRSYTGIYLTDIALKEFREPGGDRGLLLDGLASHFRSRTRVGIFAADLLYKLGMLGTVIGFVIMLTSIGDLSNFDTETLRSALQKMTGGMAVALLTTIAGLVCGILLRFQFNIADATATRILQEVVRITETALIPRIKQVAAHV